jgi:hypothetical protein
VTLLAHTERYLSTSPNTGFSCVFAANASSLRLRWRRMSKVEEECSGSRSVFAHLAHPAPRRCRCLDPRALFGDGVLRFALAGAALCAFCFGLRAELLSRADVDAYLGADLPRGLSEGETLRVPRAVWFLTVGGVVLGRWSFYLFVLHAYAG